LGRRPWANVYGVWGGRPGRQRFCETEAIHTCGRLLLAPSFYTSHGPNSTRPRKMGGGKAASPFPNATPPPYSTAFIGRRAPRWPRHPSVLGDLGFFHRSISIGLAGRIPPSLRKPRMPVDRCWDFQGGGMEEFAPESEENHEGFGEWDRICPTMAVRAIVSSQTVARRTPRIGLQPAEGQQYPLRFSKGSLTSGMSFRAA